MPHKGQKCPHERSSLSAPPANCGSIVVRCRNKISPARTLHRQPSYCNAFIAVAHRYRVQRAPKVPSPCARFRAPKGSYERRSASGLAPPRMAPSRSLRGRPWLAVRGLSFQIEPAIVWETLGALFICARHRLPVRNLPQARKSTLFSAVRTIREAERGRVARKADICVIWAWRGVRGRWGWWVRG